MLVEKNMGKIKTDVREGKPKNDNYLEFVREMNIKNKGRAKSR